MRKFAGLMCALLVVSQAVGQEQQTPGRRSSEPSAQKQPNSSAQPSTAQKKNEGVNNHLAACIAMGNQEEIALSQYGLQRAQHPKVKQFAQRMAEEHNRFLTELTPFAPAQATQDFRISGQAGRGQANGDDANADSPNRTNQKSREPQQGQPRLNQSQSQGGNTTTSSSSDRSSATVNSSSQPMDHLLAIGRQEKQRCLDMTVENLSAEQSGNFDKAFMGCQVAAHIGMIAKLETYQQHAQGELQQVLAKGAQSARQHLEEAKNIMKELASEDETRPSQQRAN